MLLNITCCLKYSKKGWQSKCCYLHFAWVSGDGCRQSEEQLKVTWLVSKTATGRARLS